MKSVKSVTFGRDGGGSGFPCLKGRQKRTATKPDLKAGDILLAISPDRQQTMKGRVLEVFPGQDDHKFSSYQNTILPIPTWFFQNYP